MELAIHQNLVEPFVEPLDDDGFRVHLPLGMSSDSLIEKLRGSLTEPQLKMAIDLLSNDEANRSFENKGHFVIVRSAT